MVLVSFMARGEVIGMDKQAPRTLAALTTKAMRMGKVGRDKIAKDCGVVPSYVSQWKSGTRQPKPEHIEYLCSYTGDDPKRMKELRMSVTVKEMCEKLGISPVEVAKFLTV